MNQENPTAEVQEIPPVEAGLNEKSAYFDVHPDDVRPEDLNNLHLWVNQRYLDQIRKYLKPDAVERVKVIRETLDAMPDVRHELETINERADRGEDVAIERNRILIPLYLALRGKGFSHYDLVK